MYIAGEWVNSSDNNFSDAINPATGEVIAKIPKATTQDVERCLAASKSAFNDSAWKNIDPAQRGRILNKMAAVTYAKAKELADKAASML